MKKQIVLMKDIEKRFGSISAIKNGFFDLYEGEIHSLIGENGAGKSTMMKILYGLYPKDGERSKYGEQFMMTTLLKQQ